MKTKYRRRNRIVGAVISLIVFSIAGWLFLNRQYVYDLFNFWNYTPSNAVANISARSSLTDTGKFYLYTSQATVEDAASFNVDCERQESKNAILGCYSNGRVYIYNVNNAELDGIKEVTAAHEMLHAAWQRLSASDKTHIGNLLEQAYSQNVTPELKTRMDYYSRNEQGQRLNELHSIIGTEVVNLPAELEAYYAKYFISRADIVSLHSKYNSVFEQLSSQSESLYAELVALEASISLAKENYDSEVASLNNDIASFNSRANSGGFSSTYTFNVERNKLTARIKNVQSEEEGIIAQIRTYNEKYKEYQALTVRSETLTQSIDSTVTPVPSL